MAETFEPAPGADGWRISTPPILSLAPVRASMAIFDEVGDARRCARSPIELTGYLEGLDRRARSRRRDPDAARPGGPRRPALPAGPDAPRRLAALEAAGVIADFREPDIIRVAPVPLYNTFHDAWRAAQVLAGTGSRAD